MTNPALKIIAPKTQVAPQGEPTAAAEIELIWDDITVGGWKDLLKKAPRSNILQTWAYAKTNLMLYRLWPRFGVFYRQGKPVAMALVTTRRLFGLEVVRIHRAPVWLVKNPSPDLVLAVLHELRTAYPAKWSRRLSFLPDLPESPKTHELLRKAGFHPRDNTPYRSSYLDLTPPLAEIQKGFSKSFRNSLKTSAGLDFTIIVDPSKIAVHDMLVGYVKDRAKGKYRGPSVKFLRTLHKNCRPHEWLLLEAWHEDQLIAVQLFVLHGNAATYQVGWTTDRGRNACAHHAMMLEAIKRLKQAGVEGLDLGGLALDKNEGLNTFKKGLGGSDYTLTGSWK